MWIRCKSWNRFFHECFICIEQSRLTLIQPECHLHRSRVSDILAKAHTRCGFDSNTWLRRGNTSWRLEMYLPNSSYSWGAFAAQVTAWVRHRGFVVRYDTKWLPTPMEHAKTRHRVLSNGRAGQPLITHYSCCWLLIRRNTALHWIQNCARARWVNGTCFRYTQTGCLTTLRSINQQSEPITRQGNTTHRG